MQRDMAWGRELQRYILKEIHHSNEGIFIHVQFLLLCGNPLLGIGPWELLRALNGGAAPRMDWDVYGNWIFFC